MSADEGPATSALTRPDVSRALATAGPAPGSGRRTDIESLRAIAVTSVVLYHASVRGFAGGYAGVDVFFVISGYLITSRLVSEATTGRGVAFRDFYARRARRILPMATLVIAVTLAVAAVTESKLHFVRSGPDAQAAALFFSNIRFVSQGTTYLGEAGVVSAFQQFWSLSLEEQFYLLWPALMMFVMLIAVASGKSVRTLAGAALWIIVAVSFTLSVQSSGSTPIDAFFLLQYRTWELGVGAIVAVYAVGLAQVSRPLNGVLVVVGLAAITAAVVGFGAGTTWPGWAAAVPVLGTALVITAGIEGPVGLLNRALAISPVQALGRYSYSLYLWHWPLIVLLHQRGPRLSVSIAVALSVVLSVVSFHLIERPVQTSVWLRSRTNVSLLLGLILALIATAASLLPSVATGLDSGRRYYGPVHHNGSPPIPTGFVPSNLQPDLVDGTNETDPYAESNVTCRQAGQCSYGNPNADLQVVLFGDSHAGQWTAALARLADEKGWHVQRLTMGGCGPFTARALCRRWIDATWKTIRLLKPDLLVLSNGIAPSMARNPAMIETGVRQALAEAPQRQTQVAVLSQNPRARSDVPSCLSDHLEDAAACEPSRAPGWLRTVNAALRAGTVAGGATFVDLTPVLCTTNRCPAIAENLLVYRDNSHLASAFTRSRGPDLGRLLRPSER